MNQASKTKSEQYLDVLIALEVFAVFIFGDEERESKSSVEDWLTISEPG
jgi:hypothetical protein